MSRKIKINDDTRKEALEAIRLLGEERLTYEQIGIRMQKGKDYIYELLKSYKPILKLGSVITRYDYLRLSGEVEKIISLYQSGISTIAIAEKYNTTDHTVANWLRKSGVELRDSGIISKIDQSLFNDITNEIEAYTLGLITSDGNISKEGATISITLTKDDSYILETINERLLNGNGNILVTHKNESKPRVVLQFNGRHIKESLKRYGVVPRKSYTLTELSKEIPEDLYHHYLRGLFDGDGVCAYETSTKNHKKVKTVRVGFCGHNKEFVESYRNFLVDKLNMAQNKLFNTGGCWQCSWSKKEDLQNFYNYIYEDATIFLGRKKKKIFDYVNTEVN